MSDLSEIWSMSKGNYKIESEQLDRVLDEIKILPGEHYERVNDKNKKRLFEKLKWYGIRVFYYEKWDNYWYVSIENSIRWFHFKKSRTNNESLPKKSYITVRVNNNNYTIKIIEDISWDEINLSINDKIKIYNPNKKPETGLIETIRDSIFGLIGKK